MSRYIVVLVAIIGLSPLVLISVLNLCSTLIVLYATRSDFSEPGTRDYFGGSVVRIPGLGRLALTSHVWPSLVILTASCILIIAALFLLPRQPNQDITSGRLSKIGGHIRQVLLSENEFSSFTIMASDMITFTSVTRKEDGEVILSVCLPEASRAEREAIRDYCLEVDLSTIKDEVFNVGVGGQASWELEYSLPDDSGMVTELCLYIWRDVFKTSDKTLLDFTLTNR